MTADLRREEIARIADVLRKSEWLRIALAIQHPAHFEHVADRLLDAGLTTGSQDTATARIAELERWETAGLSAIENIAHGRVGAAIAGLRAARDARAVLSGETRTGGETTVTTGTPTWREGVG